MRITVAHSTVYRYKTCRQVIRAYGGPWPAEQTLSLQEGSCRDLAVLFCDVCRVMGIAARFVSGYEGASAGRGDPYMHAWAEVYLPGIGWRGYDPSRGLVVSNAHGLSPPASTTISRRR